MWNFYKPQKLPEGQQFSLPKISPPSICIIFNLQCSLQVPITSFFFIWLPLAWMEKCYLKELNFFLFYHHKYPSIWWLANIYRSTFCWITCMYYCAIHIPCWVLVVCSYSLSETGQCWKFWLTPLPSLRSKAHKVIWEILPRIEARFAFKLGLSTSLPASIVYIQHCTNSPLSWKYMYCKSHKYAMSGAIFNVFENYECANLKDFQCYKWR